MNETILKLGEDISPSICQNEAKLLVKTLYGVNVVKIKELNGYDDKNFLITSEEKINEKCEFVLKIMNKLDSEKLSFVEAQNNMMLFLNENNINCPYPVKNIQGTYYSTETLSSGVHVVRLLIFLPGKIFNEMSMTTDNFFEAGKYVANLDKKLENFHHSSYENHKTLWMLDSVPELSKFIYALSNEEDKQLVIEIINEFETKVFKTKNIFKHGIIHGDFNEQNIVVQINDDRSWSIHGILDFGDSQYSALVFELAVALTYMILQGNDLDVAGHFLAGYSTIREIPEEEYEILKVCIASRLCQSLVLGMYSHLLHPENKYILSTQAIGWQILRTLWNEPKESLYKKWRSIQNSYK